MPRKSVYCHGRCRKRLSYDQRQRLGDILAIGAVLLFFGALATLRVLLSGGF